MANRRRSTRRRRRTPIRPATRRPTPSAEAQPRRVAATDRPAPAATVGRRTVSLPSLPHLRRDLLLSAALGVGLTLVVIVVGLVTG
ncbi:MAG: hypothetical protein OXR64_03600 [Chloroflexota bacterium]|nr:hypothetical protein [Chloroflexota bacterium]MDE2918909.1 hypothetical protein [Chloroflexota bacterium]